MYVCLTMKLKKNNFSLFNDQIFSLFIILRCYGEGTGKGLEGEKRKENERENAITIYNFKNKTLKRKKRNTS